MKKKMVSVAIIVAFVLTACARQSNSNLQTQEVDTTSTKTARDMKNIISIVEISTEDFSRARAFYQTILDVTIEETEMDGIKMGLFPDSGGGVFVQLINGSGYKPSADGTIVYLNGGGDLQKVADKIEASGGKIVVPKTEIAPGMGFFAMFTDTEGNKLGLYSEN